MYLFVVASLKDSTTVHIENYGTLALENFWQDICTEATKNVCYLQK